MRLCTVILLLCLTLCSNPARGEEEVRYRLYSLFSEELASMAAKGQHRIGESVKWRTCSNYFAAARTASGNTYVLFIFVSGSLGSLMRNTISANIRHVEIVVHETTDLPQVTPRQGSGTAEFKIRLNKEDFAAGLPCLGDGRVVFETGI